MLDLSQHRLLITGTAGFIGFHVARTLLEQGHEIWSFDSIDPYYSVKLKQDRLDILNNYPKHHFQKGLLQDKDQLASLFSTAKPDIIIHLAAQAGVRYSLTHPQAYIDSNIQGFGNVLEECRRAEVKHLVYASSSSVYGANTRLPFSEKNAVSHPLSLYAATKKSNELMAHSYSHTCGLPTTGLRFFTVYGPWGRPDMAIYLFTHAISNSEPIDLFNYGRMRRDFTYIDDIVQGVLSAACTPPTVNPRWNARKANPSSSLAPWAIYNLGNNRPCAIGDIVRLIEKNTGMKAKQNLLPMQTGDLPATCADIRLAIKNLGFKPATSIEEGIANFVDWYKSYY